MGADLYHFGYLYFLIHKHHVVIRIIIIKMKKIKLTLAAIAALFFVTSIQAQTADEIVNKYVDAIGGKEKMLALKSVKLNGSMNVQGMDIGIVVTAVNGVGSRTDISVPGMGEGFQIMNAKKGWNFMPFQGQASPEEVSPEVVKSSQNQLDIQGGLVNYKEKGSKVELLGKETVDGTEAYKLKLTNSAGKESTYFIDTKTYYRIKSVAKTSTPEGEVDVETSYSDFKKTPEGYLFPFAQTNSRGTVVFSSIEINKPVDEKIFTAE